MKITLDDYPHLQKYPVQWGEMDAARHVNNLVYLRWAESGRIAYFNAVQINPSFEKGTIGPILGWQDCKYIFPVTFPDVIIVGTRTLEIKADRLILESGIFSEKHNRIAAISKQSIIPYDYTELKKVPIPENWINSIQSFEKELKISL